MLRRIRAQEGVGNVEVVVVDSGSTDGTTALAEGLGARVHRIRQEEFGHGRTRNLGVSLARGEFVALLVQDALPADTSWLAAMVESLRADEQVAGVYGRQIPRPDHSLLTRALAGGALAASLERREQRAVPGESPSEAWQRSAFDDVSSCIRRSVWERIPFEETSFGEDLRWGKSVTDVGYTLVYEPRSTVIHSHQRGARYDLCRSYVNQQLLLDLFGLALVPGLPRLALGSARDAASLALRLHREAPTTRGGKRMGGGPRLPEAATALRYAALSNLGAYLACRQDVLRWLSPAFARRLERALGEV